MLDIDAEPGRTDVDVILIDGGGETVLLSDEVDLMTGRRLVVEVRDVPLTPGAADGERVFNDRAAGACDVCHSVEAGEDGVGPSLHGVATSAQDRVEGLDAAQYLRQSILLPETPRCAIWPPA